MPTRTPNSEPLVCFDAAVELASAAIASGALSSDADAVRDYILKMYPCLKSILKTLTF